MFVNLITFLTCLLTRVSFEKYFPSFQRVISYLEITKNLIICDFQRVVRAVRGWSGWWEDRQSGEGVVREVGGLAEW